MDAESSPTTSLHVLRPRKINNFLSAEAYMKRWPLLPQHEVLATSVVHPKGRNKDGTPWRWILNRAAIKQGEDRMTVMACVACATDLSGKYVRMPTYALANDNLMLREPMAFRRSDKSRLSPVTFCMLALARMVVQKIVAEKDRRADPLTKQKGIRGNTICFPQAVVKELVTSQLPADSETSRQFFSESLCIVFAGCNPEDLDKATWAEVPRDAYVSAVRFLIAHSSAYNSLTLN